MSFSNTFSCTLGKDYVATNSLDPNKKLNDNRDEEIPVIDSDSDSSTDSLNTIKSAYKAKFSDLGLSTDSLNKTR